MWPHAVTYSRLEGAVALAQEHAHTVATVARRHHVELAIAFKVPHRDRVELWTRAVSHRRLECSVAIAQKHAHGATGLVCQRQVKLAITVKVPDRDRLRK